MPLTAAAIEAWIAGRLVAEYGLDQAALDPRAPFESYGLASREVVMLSGDLEEWLGLSLSPVLLYEYPSLRALAEHLAALKNASQPAATEPAAQASPPTVRVDAAGEPIAIIGLAGRFPGADSVAAFWQALVEGKDCITTVPPDRWAADRLADALSAFGKRSLTPYGGFLDRVDEFDAGFFGISGREAAHLDPQQRLLLEVTWEALADAGLPAPALAGEAVGVYVGISSSEYGQAQMNRLDQINSYFGTGNALSVAANRLSYFFDWRGPSVAVDTACSSSLVAAHLACQSLRSGETRLAVAAGANLILTPAVTLNFSEAGAMAADGRCKAFDARADGYVRSEGVGVVVLKPLSRALADGDRVYAVLLGSAVNQDGRTNGLMAPNPRAQEAVLSAAYEAAGISPAEVAYVEAHGTGTLLGDPIEAKALAAVRQSAAGSATAVPLRIGSVKTNVGHLEAAAGVAGLIKTALALHHRYLPASLHFETPNPHIPFEALPLRVQTQGEPWPPGARGIAGVSSFGFGGTNAHVVVAGVEEVGLAVPAPGARPDAATGLQLLLLSARTPEALAETAQRWRDWLADSLGFEAVCYSAARRQTHLEQRLALVAGSAAEARALLERYLAGEADARVEAGAVSGQTAAQRVVFVCPGQGGQWPGMARQLLREQPVFRQSLEQTRDAFRPLVDWDLLEVLQAGEPPTRIDIIQPVLFAVSVALAALWRAMGVTPAAVVGHSLGEVAAAHLAGALSLEDASRVICRRSQLLRTISGNGLMAMVELSAAAAEEFLKGHSSVALAVVNSPRSVVVSGEASAVEAALSELEARGVYCRRVKVDVASHSHQVDVLQGPLLGALAGLQPHPAHLPMYSTVTGAVLEGPELTAAYWADNLRQPVLFAPAVERLLQAGFGAFVELSPHPVLLPAIGELPLVDRERPVLVASMRRDAPEWAAFLAGLGKLHAHGYPIDWTGLFAEHRPQVSLPAYPWQRERYWFEPGPDVTRGTADTQGLDHPLAGVHTVLATEDAAHLWQRTLSLRALPYLSDHRVQGQAVFPAAGYLEMALAAASRFAGERPICLANVRFEEALVLPAEGAVPVQLALTAEGPGEAAFVIASASEAAGNWSRHARGLVRVGEAAPPAPTTPAEARSRLGVPMGTEAFYAMLAARGLQYGPAFQRVAEAWRGAGEGLVRLKPMVGATPGYQIHPAVLDGAFQAVAAALVPEADGRLFLPAAVDALHILGRPSLSADLWACVHLRDGKEPAGGVRASLVADIYLFDEADGLFAVVSALRLAAAGDAPLSAEDKAVSRWFYRTEWEPQPLSAAVAAPAPGAWLLLAPAGEWRAALVEQFTAAGQDCVVVAPADDGAAPAHLRRVLDDLGANGRTPAGIIYAWGQAAEVGDLPSLAVEATTGALHLVQALAAAGWREAPRLFVLTGPLAAAPLAGLAVTVLHEHPELRCTVLEVGADTPTDAVVRECLGNTPERHVRLAGEARLVARLHPAATRGHRAQRRGVLPSGQPHRLNLGQPGLLDSLQVAPLERRAPGAGEVEIAIEAAGLNFLDVLTALGQRPDQQGDPQGLGFECAGTITAVGQGVTGLRAGDEVIALAAGAFASHVTTPAALVAHKPAALAWAPAATVPIAFLTAYYALHHVARVQPGERVLIHSAASGTGLAAVQVARWLGAEIYATAGTHERRAGLRALGVRHASDSRTLGFVDAVRAATAGEGVDVVLNSLSGEAIPASLSLLRPRGRFVELGKRDLYAHRKVGLYALRRNLSISVVDLASLAADEPALIGQLLAEVLPHFGAGTFTPLPHEVFPLAEAADAFRHLAQARHRGKVVLAPAADGRPQAPGAIRPDGTYLITGGLGAIGRQVARYLVEQGARYLVLAGRTHPSTEALADIDELEALGAQVRAAKADAASLSDLREVFSQFGVGEWPPLRGIFHAAGVLDDGLLLQQTAARFERVMAPKVAGSWHLHSLSLNHPVEHFVLFSSAAALVGSPGQAAYAAGNAFMDALAHWRQAQGLPALSLQWGPWAEIGLAARPDRAGRLSDRGFEAIRPALGVRALDRALAEPGPVLAIMPFDVRQWRQSYPQAAGLPLLAVLAQAEQAGPLPEAGQLRGALLAAASPKAQQALLEQHLRREIAEVLRIPASRIGLTTPLDSLGFDSLLALELRNRLEQTLAVRLSATLIWNYTTLPALMAYLGQCLGIDTQAAARDNEPSIAKMGLQTVEMPEIQSNILAEVEGLSDEDALRELMGDG